MPQNIHLLPVPLSNGAISEVIPQNGKVHILPPRTQGSAPAGAAPKRLSPREQEVLLLVADGKSTKEIANALGITFRTAACHRSNLMVKFGVHEAVTLVRCAIRRGLIEP